MGEEFVVRPLEDQLCFEIYKASHGVSKMYTRALKPYRLTFPQYLVLLALWDKEEVRITALQNRLGISIGTLNPVLNHLEEEGWIQKKRSTSDKRSVIISTTLKAKRQKKEIACSIQKEIIDCQAEEIDPQKLSTSLKELNRELDTLEKRRSKEKQLAETSRQ